MRIVFLGFGVLGEELLSCALQDNIFHPDQKIEYSESGIVFWRFIRNFRPLTTL